MKRKNYITKIYSDEGWHNARKKTIGGSEAAAVVGKSAWLTPNDLYNKLVLGKEKAVPENERMKTGTLAENHIRQLYALDNPKLKIKHPPVRKHWFFIRKDKPYLSCTPDGLGEDAEGKFGIEVKHKELRSKEDKNAWEGGLLPDQYYYQLLQYLVVLNDLVKVILVAHLVYFTFNEETKEWVYDHAEERPFVLYRQDVQSHIAYLENKETSFYENNILGRKRPKLVIKFNK